MMIKKILLAITVLPTLLFSQNTFVPDDNFEQALIDLGYDSGTLDNNVPTVNINGITDLDVSNKNISDLTGIADFIALETVTISGNPITTVDFTSNSNLLFFLAKGPQDAMSRVSLQALWAPIARFSTGI